MAMAKPGGLLAILGKPAPDEEGADDDMGSDKAKLTAALRDFFTSGKAGDFDAAAEAFKDACKICETYEDEEEAPASKRGAADDEDEGESPEEE